MGVRCRKCGFIMKDGMSQCPLCYEYIHPQRVLTPTTRFERITNADELTLYVDEGSFWGGFFLVFFLGFIGMIIAAAISKRKTTLGAMVCFIIDIVVFVAAVIYSIIYWNVVYSYLQLILEYIKNFGTPA